MNLIRDNATLTLIALMAMMGKARAEAVSNRVESTELRIIWSFDKQKTADEGHARSDAWAKSCRNLGEKLTVGKGPYGTGVFAKYHCSADDVALGALTSNDWLLRFTENSSLVQVSLSDEAGRIKSKFDLSKDPNAYLYLQDSDYADFTALLIMDQLPFMGRLKAPKGKAEFSVASPAPKENFSDIMAGENMNLFELRLDQASQVYRAKVVGTLEIETPPKPPLEIGQKPRKSKMIVRLEKPVLQESNQWYWFHNSEGKGKVTPSLRTNLAQTEQKLWQIVREGKFAQYLAGKYLPDGMISGYVGIRYGKQLLQGDALAEKMTSYGVVAEVNKSFLRGFRFYFEAQPKVSNNQDGFDTSIAWSRLIVGRSFSVSLPILVDRLDFTPKLGIWSFRANLPTTLDEDGKVSEVGSFELTNAASLGVEVGATWTEQEYSIRPWYGFDGALSIGRLGSKHVTSNRWGVDGAWAVGKSFSLFSTRVRPAVLAFGTLESITITDNSEPEVAEGDSRIVGLNYTGGYIGLGLGLSW